MGSVHKINTFHLYCTTQCHTVPYFTVPFYVSCFLKYNEESMTVGQKIYFNLSCKYVISEIWNNVKHWKLRLWDIEVWGIWIGDTITLSLGLEYWNHDISVNITKNFTQRSVINFITCIIIDRLSITVHKTHNYIVSVQLMT